MTEKQTVWLAHYLEGWDESELVGVYSTLGRAIAACEADASRPAPGGDAARPPVSLEFEVRDQWAATNWRPGDRFRPDRPALPGFCYQIDRVTLDAHVGLVVRP